MPRTAKHNRVTPYALDKMFRLIGSGDFYQDGFEIGGHKEEFLRVARKELGQRAHAVAAGR